MNRSIKKKIARKLIEEFDLVCRHYFNQPLDEVINDLRVNCIVARAPQDPINLISDINKSGILFFSSDAAIVYLRKAFDRFDKGLFGLCISCGTEIPEDWLSKNPLTGYCSYCMLKVRTKGAEMEKPDSVYYS